MQLHGIPGSHREFHVVACGAMTPQRRSHGTTWNHIELPGTNWNYRKFQGVSGIASKPGGVVEFQVIPGRAGAAVPASNGKFQLVPCSLIWLVSFHVTVNVVT